MEPYDLAQWLLRNAGPSIRFRTRVDILQEQDVGLVGQALNDMLESPEVFKWMDRLTALFDLNSIHSNRYDAYENVMGKLVYLGQRAGLQPFDSKTLPFRVWLADQLKEYPERPSEMFACAIVGSCLAYAGYGSTSMVERLLIQRLETLYSFAKDPDLSGIFLDRSKLDRILREKEQEIVNPNLYRNQEFMLPWAHDIRGFSYCEEIMSNQDYRSKLSTVLELVFTEEYQDLPKNYGLFKYGMKYLELWRAVHLPGFRTRPEGKEFAELLLTLEYMCRFVEVREGTWFKEMMEYLDTFMTITGTYEFPESWLPESNRGYWINGDRMQLDERKGNPMAIECESTFHMLQIKTIMNRR